MAKKFSQEEFEKKVKEKYHGDLIVISEYINSKSDITLQCNEGHIFTVKAEKLTKTDGLKGCPKCSKKTEEDYKQNPNFCLFCGEMIEYTTNYAATKVKKFCNQSCAASYNNVLRVKEEDRRQCLNCGKELNSHQKKYCCNKCQKDYSYKQYIAKWKNGEVTGAIKGGTLSNHIRNYIFEKYKNKCAQCGWDKKNPYSGRYALEIEHIDGNHENNTEDNLLLLCPNCHSLTPTYKALNYGNGRPNRRYTMPL